MDAELTQRDEDRKQTVDNAVHNGFYFTVFHITFVNRYETASSQNF